MADLGPVFSDALQQHNAPSLKPHRYNLDDIDEFLKEAYRINKHIAELTSYLRSIRQSYLAINSHQPRRTQLTRNDSYNSVQKHDNRQYLTDAQRTEIDASAKQLLRELNAKINNLSDVEAVRQQAEKNVSLKKRSRGGLGALGRWAAGGAITAKSLEELDEEERHKVIQAHREGVIWYLQRKLEEAGMVQSRMMEVRLEREVEKSKSVLYKTRGSLGIADMSAGMDGDSPDVGTGRAGQRGHVGTRFAQDSKEAEQQLSPEQLQLFAQENQDMLKHYEDTLDQVRTAERSLLEISELQTTLASNLATQSAHIDQLVQDSFMTKENVGSGNKELKKASERKSTARLVFWATGGFCATLVLWDLLI
ncbi:hypothetical protein B0A49_11998 [Cryomyces minteri]|uniref:t-SNARE coiled-coil homology domain-containing protein n=2 Tax=Cryomyces minteri TaxID=331657 RepID=A0A4U0VF89_9PEZI|nr:hypothetical protein B0A49_11998 [Cryomyces minteri]